MAYDPVGRQILPQNAAMQQFSFAPPNVGPREGQKNYVFVDEHNRHKRLKVMRACEGCRRRKIKCDAATTNTWPCSACTRLKLHCVPPTVNQEREFASGQNDEYDSGPEYMPSSEGGLDELPPRLNLQQPLEGGATYHSMDPNVHYGNNLNSYTSVPYSAPLPDHHQIYQATPTQLTPSSATYPSQHALFPSPPGQHGIPAAPAPYTPHDESPAEDLSEAFGELNIGVDGVAPYIRQQKNNISEPAGPVQDDLEINLPPLKTGSGSHVRIPPELMPSQEDAMHYFDVFFADVHPYVPVINRSYFYQQWQTNRTQISPLLLEAVFACAGRMSDDPAQGAQWLALAARHEEYFLDTPRLSTLQALLILMKARESVPKRGYYYRSWMTCKTMVSMAKDLELHEHFGTHAEGKNCGSSPIECLTKTRVWQTLLVCEMMVGGPQGRQDMGVDPDTVDIRPKPDNANINEYELQLSRQFAFFVRNARNIRLITDASHKMKKNKDWGSDPRWNGYNVAFAKWPEELPTDLQLQYPVDGSPPWLPSHFVGNMHSHYHLGVVMLSRPQIMVTKNFAANGPWRQHMSRCYSSAKVLCRLQEAILETFGLTGLLCMQRGINFTIYAVLTCTLIHLVAITSPDPEFHTDAREYFTRHMRILEQCTAAWPMPEMQSQIDALRVAFSADVNKPFELRLNFPYGSPSESYHATPPMDVQYQQPQYSHDPIQDHHRHLNYAAQPITPPISAGPVDGKGNSPESAQLGLLRDHHAQSHGLTSAPAPLVDQSSWNPTKIFDQWNTAFATPPAALAPAPSSANTNSPPMPLSMGTTTQNMSQLQSQYSQPYTQSVPGMNSIPQSVPQANYMSGAPIFVTSKDWQHSVASVFDPEGLKRRYNYGPTDIDDRQGKRMR